MRDNAPSRTAEAVCLIRAVEQRREEAERILLDPYAREFLGPLSRATLSTVEATGRVGEQLEQAALGLVPYVLCRHRFIDDALAAFLADPAPCQVVLATTAGPGASRLRWRGGRSLRWTTRRPPAERPGSWRSSRCRRWTGGWRSRTS